MSEKDDNYLIAVAALEAIGDRRGNPFQTRNACGSPREIAEKALSAIRGEYPLLRRGYLDEIKGKPYADSVHRD